MKTRYIKYLALPLMLASAWSCTDMTEDAVNEATGGGTVKEIVLQLPELKTADTRTEFTVDEVNKTLKTAWAEGDVAGIFPTTGYNQVEFPISDSWGESVARFDGGDWALRANKSYAAYFPFNKANFERDASSIILSYEGQKQEYNGSISHLSDYDYLATGAAQADAYGSIYFQMQRLSGIVRFEFNLPEDEESSFVKLFLDSNEEIFDVEKALNITGENPELGSLKSAKRISMSLANISADDNHQIIVYMTLPPMNFEKEVNIMLMKEDGSMLGTDINSLRVESACVQSYAFTEFETILNTNIDFEDDAVKAICVENWDLNGDGEFGTAEAALVTSLGGKFADRGDLKSFNEFQYFTGLTTIEGAAFDCSGIRKITIPMNVTNIEGRAFGYNNLISVTSKNPRYKVYDECMVIDMVENKLVFNFNDQAIKEVIIPDFVTTIGETAFAFQFEGIRSVSIPTSVTTIESGAFEDCRSLESIEIPNSVTSIGGAAFGPTCYALKTITIPSSVTSIGALAFSNVINLEIININNSRYSIMDNGLLVEDGYKVISCLGNKNVLTVSSEITEMGNSFYWSCPNILIMESANPPGFDGNFCHPENFVIYVSAETVETYKTAEGWSNYAQYIRALPEWSGNISFADADVKSFCLEKWDIDKDGELSYLEAGMPTGNFPGPEMSAIDHSYSFNEFQYFTGYDFIGGFYWCGNMTEVSVPATITSIDGYSGFGYCDGLEKITSYSEYYSVINGCQLIDNRTNQLVFFFNSANNQSVTISSDVTSIGAWAFGHHDGVKNVVLPNSVTRIENHAFCLNNTLESITLPETVTYIGPSAFVGCHSLTSLIITATTPPQLVYYDGADEWTFDEDDNLLIYVPQDLLDVYKTDTYWSRYADKIRPIV